MPKIVLIGSIAGSLVNFRGDLIREWIERGYTVTTVSRPSKEVRKEKIRALGAAHRVIPIERDGLSPFKDLKLIFGLAKIFREEKPDYIFAYTVKPVIYSAISARAAAQAELFFMITGLGYAFSGKSFKQRIIRQILSFFYRLALKKSEAVFFQNRDDLAVFKDLKLLTDQNKVVMVNGSGVNIEHFYFSRLPENSIITFLLIGRLLESKGIREYAGAAEVMRSKYGRQVQFKLLGRQSESPDSIARQDLNRWQEEGTLEYLGGTSDVRPYLEACTVYVLPSYREGTPRSVLEAMAMGRAIITTAAPGCRETVTEGLNGFLVPVRNVESLVEAMEKFVDEPGLAKRMGAESRKIAEDKYDVRKVNRVILDAMQIK